MHIQLFIPHPRFLPGFSLEEPQGFLSLGALQTTLILTTFSAYFSLPCIRFTQKACAGITQRLKEEAEKQEATSSNLIPDISSLGGLRPIAVPLQYGENAAECVSYRAAVCQNHKVI